MPDTTPDINVTTVFLLLGELKEGVKAGFEGVNARLDKVNGKVGTGETTLATHSTRLAVLEAAQEEDRKPGHEKWWMAGIGTVIVAALELGKAVVSAWMK